MSLALLNEERVLHALQAVIDPELGVNVVLVWGPPWALDRISAAGWEVLGWR